MRGPDVPLVPEDVLDQLLADRRDLGAQVVAEVLAEHVVDGVLPEPELPAREHAGTHLRVIAGRGFGMESPVHVFADTFNVAVDLAADAELAIEAEAVKTLQEYNGIVEQATEEELANAAAKADLSGLFNCPHTGVALAALEKLVARGEVQKNDRVVVISTATGLKFTEFKIAYHSKPADGQRLYANPPMELPNDYDAVRQAIDQATAAADDETRKRSYQEVQRRVAEDAPYISLWYKTNVAVAQHELSGIRLTPLAPFTFLKNVVRQPGAISSHQRVPRH